MCIKLPWLNLTIVRLLKMQAHVSLWSDQLIMHIWSLGQTPAICPGFAADSTTSWWLEAQAQQVILQQASRLSPGCPQALRVTAKEWLFMCPVCREHCRDTEEKRERCRGVSERK
jgi:hypothetical protein